MKQTEHHPMDIAVKYQMISKIISSEDDNLLNSIKTLLKIEDEGDFWDELSVEDQQAINEGLSQLDAGQHVSRQSIQKEIKDRFNF